MLFLGIDTSNYTTSLALADGEGNVLANIKAPLPVREGERGLRQSDAVFHHVKNLPAVSEELGALLRRLGEPISAVACSATPRDSDGSYMPCFLAGLSCASLFAQTNGVPLYKVSHQAGHIMAALTSACKNSGESAADMLTEPFTAFHVSGGTTDILLCEPEHERVFKITQIGGTRDINAGQAIDRTGVRMNIPFPCGAEMDRLALTCAEKLSKPKLSVDGTWCNLSGLENKAAQMYTETGDLPLTSAYTLDFIAKTLEKLTLNAAEQYGKMKIIYAGGVMSSEYIRKTLSKYGMFADAAFSSDNAAGVACLGAVLHRRHGLDIK